MSCRTCGQIICINPSDVELYSLQSGFNFRNSNLSFLVSCPEGMICQPGFWPRVINIPEGTITVPVPPNPQGQTITIQCCQSTISEVIPSTATTSDIAAIINDMIYRCAQQQAECDNIVTGPPGVPPPVPVGNPSQPPHFRNQIVTSTVTCDLGVDFSGPLPGWITFDGVDTFTGMAGVFSADTQAAANAKAQYALGNFIAVSKASGFIECVSIQCVSQVGLITLGGGATTIRNNGIIPTDSPVRRILATLQNSTLAFVDTSTDSVVGSVSLNVGSVANGYPFGCWVASNNRFWVLSDSDSPVRSVIRMYDADGAFITSVNVGQTMENLSYNPDADTVFAGSNNGGGFLRLRGFNNVGGGVLDVTPAIPSIANWRVWAKAPGLVLIGNLGQIRFLNTSGSSLGTLTTPGGSQAMWGAYAVNTGQIYVGMFDVSSKIWEINPSTRVVDHAFSVNASQVRNVSYEPNTGAIYSLGTGGPDGRVITVINPMTREIVCAVTALPGTSNEGIAVDFLSGKLYRAAGGTTNNLYIYEQ